MKVLIDFVCHNRREITELSLQHLHKSGFDIRIWNDNSTEYDNKWLEQWAKEIHNPVIEDKRNWKRIHFIRYNGIKTFIDSKYDFLYIVDNDVVHDPGWVKILKMAAESNLPASLYRSKSLGEWTKIKSYDDNFNRCVGAYGGASMLITKKHAKRIVAKYNKFTDIWDCLVWRALGNQFIVPKTSYCEHFGANGIHHKNFRQERAENLTPYLEKVREDVIHYLQGKKSYNELSKKLKL